MSRESHDLNRKRIEEALHQHALNCEYPADEIAMSPFEAERFVDDRVRGVPIVSDPSLPTGRFKLHCGRDESHSPAAEGETAGSSLSVTPGAPSVPSAPTKPGQREAA